MSTARKLDELLQELGRAPVPVETPDVVSERGARAVERIAVSIQDAARMQAARRRTNVIVALAAAALVVLAIGGVWRALAGGRGASGQLAATGAGPMLHGSASGVMLGRGGREQPASASAAVPLIAGDELSTASGAQAMVELASGAQAMLTPLSRVALSSPDPQAERLRLTLGTVSVRVPPLAAGASLSVETPHAVVVVHGTAFTVRVERETTTGTTTTHVAVSEGRVSVESRGVRSFLGPGDHWSSAAAPEAKPARAAPESPAPAVSAASAAASASPVAPAARPSAATGGSAAALDARASAQAPSSASQLAVHNALFASAMAARQRGDERTALAKLDELLARSPNGPLAPEARVERFRALKRLGRDSEAAREARRYLHEQRNGTARDEARDIALSGK